MSVAQVRGMPCRRAAKRNKLPIHKIIEVSVLKPYFYL
jgi:hypothetical protein